MTTLDSSPADTAAITNIYLEGNYAPVEHEVTAFDLDVVGELPTELNGRYLRNGPNPLGSPDPRTHHWFIGDGMVHGVRLRDGRAEWYRNRYVGSTQHSQHLGDADFTGPNWSGSGVGPNTNVGGFAQRTWAMVEAGGTPVELTYELESIARNDFFGTLPGAFTAHPKFDPTTGEMHAMVYASQWLNPDLSSKVQYLIIGTDGRVRHALDIPTSQMIMLHDMALTERYAVIYDLPVTFRMELLEGGYPFPLGWNPDYGARLGLLPRTGGTSGGVDDIIWIDVPLSYVFHPMNAYDAPDGTVVIDHCVYDTMFDHARTGPFGEGFARFERWVLDPLARRCSTTVIDDRANEFPRHRGSLSTKPYRFGYCASPSDQAGVGWPTLKHDIVAGTTQVFDHGAGRCAGEPVFIGRSGSTSTGDGEDDGWVMTMVHDTNDGSAELVLIDAKDFDGGYVARVRLPQRVPFGFHGNWVSDASMGL